MSTLGDMLGAAEEPCGPCGGMQHDVEGGGECSPLQTLLMVLIIVLLLVGAWFMWKQCCANGTCTYCAKASSAPTTATLVLPSASILPGQTREGFGRTWVGKEISR